MYGAFQSNAFQSNAFQIIRSGSSPTPTPTPTATPGPGDLQGPSLEWLLYVEEQKRLDEERDRRNHDEKQAQEQEKPQQPPAIEAAAVSAQPVIRHALREAEAKARHHELIEKAKADKALLDEMIIVGFLSI